MLSKPPTGNMVKDNFAKICVEVLNRHVPVKQKHVIPNQVGFINKTLNNAISRINDVNSKNAYHK